MSRNFQKNSSQRSSPLTEGCLLEKVVLKKVDACLRVLPIHLLKAHEEINEEALKALLIDLKSSRVPRRTSSCKGLKAAGLL